MTADSAMAEIEKFLVNKNIVLSESEKKTARTVA